MTSEFLSQFYTVDSETGDYIIDIGLEEYDDIFNNWDSSVYNLRGLDDSLQSFLEECSRDVSLNHDIILRFNLHSQKKDKELEGKIKESIRNYFKYSLYKVKQEMKNRVRKIVFYVLFYSIFVSLSFYLQGLPGEDMANSIILQGLTVGSWVFLWEAFSLLFLRQDQIWRRKKEYKRLLKASIRFKYE